MRLLKILSIVTGVAIAIGGCKADRTTQTSSIADSTASPQPQPTAASQPQMPVAPKATMPDNRPVVICFGDSLTAGLGTDPGQSYPDYLQADLDARGFHYRVVNEGISGNTTKDGVERLDTILALKPSVVVVEFGGNDGLRGLPIADSRANLDQIITTLQSNHIKVALAGITLPPDYGPDYIKQFDETYNLLARKHHIPMLPFILKGVFGVDGMMQQDRTHATAAGNKVVAENILPLVLPLLKK